MAAVCGFHHMAMKVRDFDKTIRFYTDVLGMKIGKSWGTDGSRAVMIDAGNDNFLEIFEVGTEADADGRVAHFALRVDDCDTLMDGVRAAGLEITDEPRDVDIKSDPVYPVRIAFFRGPSGELVELMQER